MSDATPTAAPSTYLDFLPAIFQERTHASPDEDGDGQANYVGLLLRAFEEVLSAEATGEPGRKPSLGAVIDSLSTLFQPAAAPREFLDWLARWVALTLRADLDEEQRRDFIAHAVPLYRWRGTRRGLSEIIRLYTGLEPEITEPGPDLRIGESTVVGRGRIGGGLPHTFEVRIRIPEDDAARAGAAGAADRMRRKHEVLHALIEAERPAHTVCVLVVEVPTMQIGIRSTIGLNTLLGTSGTARSETLGDPGEGLFGGGAEGADAA